jgi:hypothetical protein
MDRGSNKNYNKLELFKLQTELKTQKTKEREKVSNQTHTNKN